jgi:hypothetical protein
VEGAGATVDTATGTVAPLADAGSVPLAAAASVEGGEQPLEGLPSLGGVASSTVDAGGSLPSNGGAAASAGTTPTPAAPPDAVISLGAAPPDPFRIGLSEILPVVGSAGVAALGTAAVVRVICSPGGPIVFFQNVRLVPCYVGATVQQSTATASSVANRLSGSGRTVKSGTGGSAIGSIRDGFQRAVRPPSSRIDGDGSVDSRLLAQIGIVLGTVYLAFLTLWFWATRLRWNPRV